MRPTAPENFDGDATTDRLDPTWKAQVDLLDPTRRSNNNIHPTTKTSRETRNEKTPNGILTVSAFCSSYNANISELTGTMQCIHETSSH